MIAISPSWAGNAMLENDHKIQVRMGSRKRTRAVRIYDVGARNIHWCSLGK